MKKNAGYTGGCKGFRLRREPARWDRWGGEGTARLRDGGNFGIGGWAGKLIVNIDQRSYSRDRGILQHYN